MSTRRWVIGGVLAATAIGAVVLGLRVRGSSPKGASFITVPAERGAVVGRVTATGTLSALVTVQIGAQVSGRIAELGADFNSHVKKGQVLARLDPELMGAAVAQSRANEQAAQGNLARAIAQSKDAERKLQRAKALADQKLIAPADLDAAQAEADVARASIDAAQGTVAQAHAQRQQADVNLGYTTITSPIDGTVISRAVDVGQTVAASLSAPTLFTIAENLTKMQVDTNVAEADVGKLKEGLAAAFTVDAFAGRPFKGTIRQIRFAPQVVQNVVTYDAVIDVDNSELLLRPGMTANVTFTWARADDVLRVPNAALRFRLDSETARKGRSDGDGGRRGRPDAGGAPPGQRTLYVLRDQTPAAILVHTGVTDGTFTEIADGELKEGDAVITDKTDDGKPAPASAPPGLGGGMRGGRGF